MPKFQKLVALIYGKGTLPLAETVDDIDALLPDAVKSAGL